MEDKNYCGGRNGQPVQIRPQTNRVQHIRLKVALPCCFEGSSDSENHPNL